MKENIYHIIAEWFNDFIWVKENTVTRCSGGTFKYMIGWTFEKVVEHCKEKKWKLIAL